MAANAGIYTYGIDKFHAFIRDLRSGELQLTANKAMYRLAQAAQRMVRDEYKKQGKDTISGLARESIVQGKDKGAVRPARPPRGTTPTTMTRLARAVILRKETNAYVVRIDPAAMDIDQRDYYKGGAAPLAVVAHWIENPQPIIMDITLRMMGYLMALRRGNAGPGKSSRKSLSVNPVLFPGAIVIKPQPHPVWRTVAAYLMKNSDMFTGELQQAIFKIGRAYGMERG
jgi:hypothetical protein